jgi:hypothetical protein
MARYMVLLLLMYLLVGCGGQPTPAPNLVATQVAVEKAAAATLTAEVPTATSTPMATDMPSATPTQTPSPAPTSSPTPRPVSFSGSGPGTTEPIRLPGRVCAAKLTFYDRTMYTFEVLVDGKPLWQLPEMVIVNNPPESTERLVYGDKPVQLRMEITDSASKTDGRWAASIRALGYTDTAEFMGRGNAVSDLFVVAEETTALFQITHDTEFNFVVYLHCTSGTQEVIRVGHPDGRISMPSTVVFPAGVCFWEVLAPNSSWSLIPLE